MALGHEELCREKRAIDEWASGEFIYQGNLVIFYLEFG